jgi:hypothetical protein
MEKFNLTNTVKRIFQISNGSIDMQQFFKAE